MRELTQNEVQEVSGGAELTPSEGAVLELAVAGLAAAVGSPALALVAIGYAAILYSWD